MLERAAWVVVFGVMPLLWASGIWLFANSGLTRRKKVLWPLFLVTVGVAVGVLLPLTAIRNRFLILLLLLPVLALIDLRLARSRRTLLFWVRACSFEICTVFACATIVRLALAPR